MLRSTECAYRFKVRCLWSIPARRELTLWLPVFRGAFFLQGSVLILRIYHQLLFQSRSLID